MYDGMHFPKGPSVGFHLDIAIGGKKSSEARVSPTARATMPCDRVPAIFKAAAGTRTALKRERVGLYVQAE
jgi:hypothetical protein